MATRTVRLHRVLRYTDRFDDAMSVVQEGIPEVILPGGQ